jgi:hypothetical protein
MFTIDNQRSLQPPCCILSSFSLRTPSSTMRRRLYAMLPCICHANFTIRRRRFQTFALHITNWSIKLSMLSSLPLTSKIRTGSLRRYAYQSACCLKLLISCWTWTSHTGSLIDTVPYYTQSSRAMWRFMRFPSAMTHFLQAARSSMDLGP